MEKKKLTKMFVLNLFSDALKKSTCFNLITQVSRLLPWQQSLHFYNLFHKVFMSLFNKDKHCCETIKA